MARDKCKKIKDKEHMKTVRKDAKKEVEEQKGPGESPKKRRSVETGWSDRCER